MVDPLSHGDGNGYPNDGGYCIAPFMLCKLFRLVRAPFEAAVRAFERPVDVVIATVTRAGVGLGQRHLIMNIGVLVAQAPAAGGTGAPGVLFAEPTFHGRPLLSAELA